jgi:heparan-alpha-glucosaminide N-acetyltransferase
MLGLWAGEWLKSAREMRTKLRGLIVAGVALTLGGLVLQWLHLCPIVKRIWTSSYTLYSGGLILLILAGFYGVIEILGWKRWSFWLTVIGANSIAIYVMSWTLEHFVSESLKIHLGSAPFLLFGPPFEPVLRGISVLLVFWGILYWMYRRKIFIRI